MRTRGKPFILYEGGALPYMIVPQGWKGWTQFVIWLASLTPLVMWLDYHVDTQSGGPNFGDGLFLFGLGIAMWLVAGLWWMLARADLVRMVEIRRQKQYARRAAARARAREQIG